MKNEIFELKQEILGLIRQVEYFEEVQLNTQEIVDILQYCRIELGFDHPISKKIANALSLLIPRHTKSELKRMDKRIKELEKLNKKYDKYLKELKDG